MHLQKLWQFCWAAMSSAKMHGFIIWVGRSFAVIPPSSTTDDMICSLFSELSRSDHPRAYRYTHFINCNLFHFQVSSINYTTTTNCPQPPPLLHLLITLLQCVRASSVAIIKFRFVRNFLDELCARVVWKWFPIKLCWVGDNRCLKRLVKSNNYWPSPMWH